MGLPARQLAAQRTPSTARALPDHCSPTQTPIQHHRSPAPFGLLPFDFSRAQRPGGRPGAMPVKLNFSITSCSGEVGPAGRPCPPLSRAARPSTSRLPRRPAGPTGPRIPRHRAAAPQRRQQGLVLAQVRAAAAAVPGGLSWAAVSTAAHPLLHPCHTHVQVQPVPPGADSGAGGAGASAHATAAQP